MTRRRILVMAMGLSALVGRGAGRARAAATRLRVVATVPDLAAVARDLGGDLVTVSAMSLPTQDPHFVDAKPSLAVELNRADLVLQIGLELEAGWLPTLLVGARNPRIQTGAQGLLDCSGLVRRLDVPGGAIDRSMGDIHPGGNPHYMSDPRQVVAVARGISERLARLDPDHAGVYRKNLDEFVARLEGARKGWEARMAPYRGRGLIAYHKTTAYLANWLGLVEAGFLEPKPGIPPNPSHVAHLLGLARERKVAAVVQEEKYPEATGRLVASKLGVPFIEIPGGTRFQSGQTYAAYMGALITRLAEGLGGAGSRAGAGGG